MNVAVRTVFVGDGNPDRVASATPAPTERLASWVSIVAGGLTAPLPAPPEAVTWERALADLQAARVLYLAPSEGRDDDPGVAVLLDLADRGILTLTVGPERAPATDGPTVTGPARMDWRPAPGMQSVVRGIADDGELRVWRKRLRAAYGTDADIEIRPWSRSRWRADGVDEDCAFPVSLFARPTEASGLRDTNTFLDIVRRLRGPNGCPWDKQQTHRTLRPYLVEEAHEALAAIDRGDDDAMADELGDVLLNLVLHAEIARQRGGFAWPDVVAAISAKMIRRHPHVFGDAQIEELEDIRATWAQIKAAERGGAEGPLDNLPDSMPSLTFARSAVRALRRAGHPLDEASRHEEMIAALATADDVHLLGDALLWVAARADAADIDLDMALRDANARLRERLRDDERPT